jgi:serine/threonine protein kinase
MDDQTKRHYIAEMVAILEYLKDKKVTHRDFKVFTVIYRRVQIYW